MKRELNGNELDEVTGGSVILSQSMGMVRFSSLKRTKKLNPDVDFKTVRNTLLDLYDENENLTEEEFDTLVMNTFESLGYI